MFLVIACAYASEQRSSKQRESKQVNYTHVALSSSCPGRDLNPRHCRLGEPPSLTVYKAKTNLKTLWYATLYSHSVCRGNYTTKDAKLQTRSIPTMHVNNEVPEENYFFQGKKKSCPRWDSKPTALCSLDKRPTNFSNSASRRSSEPLCGTD